MKTVKVKGNDLIIEDFNKLFIPQERDIQQNGPIFPNNVRCVICGPSGCGKTYLIICLFVHKNGVRYKNIYIYSKQYFNQNYKFLRKFFDGLNNTRNYVDEIINTENVLPYPVYIFDDISFTKGLEKIRV